MEKVIFPADLGKRILAELSEKERVLVMNSMEEGLVSPSMAALISVKEQSHCEEKEEKINGLLAEVDALITLPQKGRE